jgi:hypothetical protein
VAKDSAFDILPIIPHENVADVDCCGCLIGSVALTLLAGTGLLTFYNSADQEAPLRIQCHVTIKRVELLSHGFWLGCHIEDYKLDTGSSALSM